MTSSERICGETYQLTILPYGSIRIEREGRGQEIDSETLYRHGWNSIADVARLIERQVRGELGNP